MLAYDWDLFLEWCPCCKFLFHGIVQVLSRIASLIFMGVEHVFSGILYQLALRPVVHSLIFFRLVTCS